MIYKTDYHVHTKFSDGKEYPDKYIIPAIRQGIRELGFSEHLSLFRSDQTFGMNPERLQDYLDCIEDLKKSNDSLLIRTGLEVDYIPGREKETETFLENKNLDYRIGSVHYMGETTVDHGPEFYEGKNIDTLYESYFEYVIGASSSGLFDIIGHCDLIRIYCFTPLSDPERLYRRLAKSMSKNDVAFELNTNGRNKPLADFYPDRRFLHIFREENVPVCVNSDAHMPSRIGQYFDEAYQLLRSAGYTEMAVFSSRKRKMISFS